ncbi:MAG: hypothetical protein J3Q66DRAFT_421621 [Benniella sp.]|nr:MAG: hypothetical protein J3Q66DRAFT_421621 [Benniella sp.]
MHLAYSLLLLFSAVAVLVQGKGRVSSKAIFTGVDNSDLKPDGYHVFSKPNNIVTFTAIVFERFANVAEFQPKNGLFEDDGQTRDFKRGLKPFNGFDFKEGSFSGRWNLVVITIHGEERNYIKIDIADVNVELSVNDAGLVSIPKQSTFIFVDRFEVDHLTLLEHHSDIPQIDSYKMVNITTVVDLLTTPKPSNQLLDAWLFGSDHACEEKSIRSKYAHRRQRLYTLAQLRMHY